MRKGERRFGVLDVIATRNKNDEYHDGFSSLVGIDLKENRYISRLSVLFHEKNILTSAVVSYFYLRAYHCSVLHHKEYAPCYG
jgi:hypothetical protein